ncbi:MAG: FdtA/QdtA family cupin domain-containing protein [Cyclobacteriaceae bacterium]|nr:FdtA/QdtA family cupin domain-containing protein [Cyclobacteriaceae bacterium]
MSKHPYCISLPKIAVNSAHLSYLDVLGDLPIDVKRFYWIYDVEGESERGNHAHLNSERLIICMSGVVNAHIESPVGKKFEFMLNDPCQVLFFPRGHWINLVAKEKSVILVACSCTYSDDLVITDYLEFKKTCLREQLLR